MKLFQFEVITDQGTIAVTACSADSARDYVTRLITGIHVVSVAPANMAPVGTDVQAFWRHK